MPRKSSPLVIGFAPRQAGRVGEGSFVGAKGMALLDLARRGLPVPAGFVIPAAALAAHLRRGRLSATLTAEIRRAVSAVEGHTGRRFASDANPLLLSVRLSPTLASPGMMPAVLNIGLNDPIAARLADQTGNGPFVYDCFGRLIVSFSEALGSVTRHDFEDEVRAAFAEAGLDGSAPPSTQLMRELIKRFKALHRRATGRAWTEEPLAQLTRAIAVGAGSWNGAVAVAHRRKNRLADAPGPAVIVQAMAFGNRDEASAVGSASTRDPATGRDVLAGEFALASQGSVSGAMGVQPLDALRRLNPAAWKQLRAIKATLEKEYRDACDFDFVLELNRVCLLSCRATQRTAVAGACIAVDLVKKKLIDRRTAVMRIDPGALDQLLHPRCDPAVEKTVIATGFAASPGAAAGRLAFSADDAHRRASEGEAVILARTETEASDVASMALCAGILTSTGGMTSHAAVVARTMARPCIVGAGDVVIDPISRTLTTADGHSFGPADWITLDGARGVAYAGRIATIEPELPDAFETILSWADDLRTLEIRANADTPHDARMARAFGAAGIGLCRTEHMFFDPERIRHMQEMILARDGEERAEALARLLPFQRDDFVGLFTAMAGLPVTIRLLDPPLHEFLPRSPHDQQALAQLLDVPLGQVQQRIAQVTETNPMLGHRGDRLLITHPEILQMQVRAIIEAACILKKAGKKVLPEIMIPLVGTRAELEHLKALVQATAGAVMRERRTRVEYRFGSMIETPRAALVADDLAECADFFSFGTNDLTQLTFGYSRDDAATFLPAFLEKGILPADPFQTLDGGGVGKLIWMATSLARSVKPSLKFGLCGEHGGDAATIRFCQESNLSYVSCSPFRVPIARLAAAQAALGAKAGV